MQNKWQPQHQNKFGAGLRRAQLGSAPTKIHKRLRS